MTETPEPLVLASTSPQRRAILEQLRIPFECVAPSYDEKGGTGTLDALVKRHATGKAKSVAESHPTKIVLGVDTLVDCEGVVLGKPRNQGEAEQMLELLSGKVHRVVSGLTLITPGWHQSVAVSTRVCFRTLKPRDLAHYVTSEEWQGRAAGYAIQGLGASLVEWIDGDYLNVVGLPAGMLVRLLADRFSGTYGFG